MKQYMKYAIEISKKGIGYTNPNPLVGAIIVKDNKIIGEGYHEMLGGPHAEINAIQDANTDVTGATMYVTLEPCSHYGRTPPCAQVIVQNKISKVIIGMVDPNPLVSGQGIKILEDAGINVVIGVLEDEIKQLNEIFIKYITTKTPFIIMKTAMTMDGKIATVTGESKWITGGKSRQHVHTLRHQVSGIMVGVGTILQDNPSLNTRLIDYQGRDPTRIIVDTNGKTPFNAKVFCNLSKSKTILATTKNADENILRNMKLKGIEIIITPLVNNKIDLKFLIEKLGSIGIDSILLEGGSTLNFSMLSEGLVDKIITFIAPKIIGGEFAKTPVGGSGIKVLSQAQLLENINVRKIGEDIIIESYVRK